MKVTVKYLPPFSDRSGVAEESVELAATDIDVAGLLRRLFERHPGLRQEIPEEFGDEELRHTMIVARGTSVARLTDRIRDGDTVKILPSVAGGQGPVA